MLVNFQHRRIKGVRDDVVIKRIFNWTANPTQAKRLALRKVNILAFMVTHAIQAAARSMTCIDYRVSTTVEDSFVHRTCTPMPRHSWLLLQYWQQCCCSMLQLDAH
jgi:hypothetical protein